MRVRVSTLASVAVAVLVSVAASVKAWRFETETHCDVLTTQVDADGRWHAVAKLWQRHGRGLTTDQVVVNNPNVHLQPSVLAGNPSVVTVLYRAPARGGEASLRIQVSGRGWSLLAHSLPDWRDRYGDGLPDALHLHDPEDRLRFRRWFTALADQAAAEPDSALPGEITDCSALLRYSYRLALMKHDDRWYKKFAPGTVPVLPSVEQWTYPETPLGVGLFRVTPPSQTGPRATDFAEFADAKTLYARNSFRVGRDVRSARPGDLLFFHQLEGEQQYHSMIVTGGAGEWVVYHTGPDGSGAARKRGEMRRARIQDLLQHPDPRWHPTANNPNFLGVFRWNLLRED